VIPGPYDVTEADPRPGYDLTDITCEDDYDAGGLNVVDSEDDSSPDNATVAGRTASLNVDPGETVKCTFTNTKRGMARVIKTVLGGLPDSTLQVTFQIRKGGMVIATDDTPEVVNSSWLYDFGELKLVPDDDYAICEAGMMMGWHSSLSDDPNAFVPGMDNSVVCVPFVLDPGETEEFVVDNTPPPGGDARTIGFWKNWSSCTGGNQLPALDMTLANVPDGVKLGVLEVNDLTCEQAFDILSKTDSGIDKKRANDAAYGLAAQMLGVILNINAVDMSGMGGPLSGPSANCTALQTALTEAQAILLGVGFDGDGKFLLPAFKALKSLRQDALYYAGLFDAYNNNYPGSLCN